MKPFIALITLALINIISCNDNPVKPEKPENRSPVIFSLTVFPEVVKPSDSLIVVCNAMDPDADTLVYDWYTSGVVRIKGLPSWGCCSRYNTHENFQVFYAPDSAHVSAPQDTFRVECAVRDGKGGQEVQKVSFIVTKDF